MSTFLGGEGSDVKLSEQEQKLVAKLFSDPTYFPVEFRTWLKNYIQDAGITVTTSQVRGSGVGERTNLPAGNLVFPASLEAVPPDCLLCDGAAYSRSIYDALWKKIGTKWGPGDSSTTFNVPDFRDRAVFVAGGVLSVGDNDGIAFGAREGPLHHHTVEDPGHAHPQPDLVLGFSAVGGTGDFGVDPGTGDRELVEFFGTSSDTTGIRVGPETDNENSVSFAACVAAITTGKAA